MRYYPHDAGVGVTVLVPAPAAGAGKEFPMTTSLLIALCPPARVEFAERLLWAEEPNLDAHIRWLETASDREITLWLSMTTDDHRSSVALIER